MKESNLSFLDGFFGPPSSVKKSKVQMAFDWDKAATAIKEIYKTHPSLLAEAGLQGDWKYTGGIIFEDGKPTNENYTYLSSNWAIPTLILSWDGQEQLEFECWREEDERFCCYTKWDETSLNILGIPL